jgi:DNA-binding MarR family transcriptional regulator
MTLHYTPDNYRRDESIGYLIARVRGLLSTALDQALAEYDMTHAQFRIFRQLQDSENAMTAGDLARDWDYNTGAMTRMLDRLEEKGFVCRSRSQTDRRVVYVELSEKGRELADRMSLAAIGALNHYLRHFSKTEVRQLKGFLRRMITDA